jgi:1-deoxy-D-xylulose-5-phosphate synthase
MKDENRDYTILRKLSESQLKVLASDIRSDILSAVLHNGGHLSSNLGAVELTMGLLREFDPYQDDILFDVGHQTYTYKLLTGRDLHNLRKTGGIGPFSLRKESPADKYDNGHAATSVSVAYGMAKAKQLTGDASATIALIGDSSVSSGLSMEALSLLSQDKTTPLIIVINDNGMSIGEDVGFMTKKFQHLRNSRFYFRTSSWLGKTMAKHRFTWRLFLHLRNFKDKIKGFLLKPTVFEAMGLRYIGPFDGHDFDSLDLAFRKAKAMSLTGPVVVHIITKKGYGYPPAMKDLEGKFHGVSPRFDEYENEAQSPESFLTYKSSFLLQKMAEDPKTVVLTPAMERGSGLEEVFRRYPERTFDVGIAEENAVTMASGFALKGEKPVIDIYSTFLQRSYDEIVEDISRENVKALFFVEKAGLVGEDGSSHHGLYDVAMARSIPQSQVFMPYDRESTEALLSEHFFTEAGPVFLRFTKEAPARPEIAGTREGNFVFYRKDGNASLYLGVGPRGYDVLSGLPSDLDKAMLLSLLPSGKELSEAGLLSYRQIFFYDPYGIEEGTADHLRGLFFRLGYSGKFTAYAFRKEFVPFGQIPDLLEENGLSSASVRKGILTSLAENPKTVK